MQRQPTRFVPCSRNTCVLQIHSYEDKCVRGHFYNPQTQTHFSFQNLMQLLLQMDGMMDQFNLPQRGVEPRFFQEKAFSPSNSGEKGQSVPLLASFQVTILFRQHASWQGVLVWNERQLESSFRSTLEFVSLLDDALSIAAAPKE